MNEKPQTVSLRYYGISPWEIEVIYNIFNEKFEVIQDVTERHEYLQQLGSKSLQMDCEECVSALTITIPLPFSEEFFKWFEFREWDNVKHIIKEMKRRRGNRKAIWVEILFENEEWNEKITEPGESPILSDKDERLPDYPHVKFVIDSSENHIFNSAIEKIDVMVELLPYHLNHSKIKNWCKPMIVDYTYDVTFSKWYVGHVLSFDGGRTFSIDDLRN